MGSIFGTGNPLLNDQTFSTVGPWGNLGRRAVPGTMTVQGAAVASGVLVGIVGIVATLVWSYLPSSPLLFPAMFGGSFLAFILVLIASFKRSWSPVLAIPIAIGEGAFTGGASVFWAGYVTQRAAAAAGTGVATHGLAASLSGGLIIQAVLLTVIVAGAVLLLNLSGIARATSRYVTIVYAATSALCLFTLVAFVLALCGVHIPYIWGSGPIGILFSLFVVGLAASHLVIDFDLIRGGAEGGQPKYMEWYSAIGVLVTLVWLYTSILRLLALLNRRN